MAKMELVTPLNEAKTFMINCFKAVGTSEEHAEIVAKNLLEADYRGHYSHGMNRLNFYIGDITRKLLDPNAKPQIEKETVAIALVNGNNGLGSVIGKYCMDLAIKKAKDIGIGMVAVHGSNHYGIAGMYALQAVEQGCIGISFTNTTPLMVPTRAQEAALGTNPLSVGAPCPDDDSFLLDMATTSVALGKLEIYRRKGEALPKGWALNKNGEMETDPLTAFKASRLFPLGGDELTRGYKGYGLGIMVEVLSGLLSGANSGPQIPSNWTVDQCEKQADLGQSFIAINPKVFAAGFEDRLSNLMNYLRHMEPRDPNKPVLVPGDPERLHMEKVNAQGGICYVANQHHSNNLLSEKLKVPPMKSMEITKV